MKLNIITEMRNNMNNLLSIINEKMNKKFSDFKAILEGLLKLTTYIDELSTHLESQWRLRLTLTIKKNKKAKRKKIIKTTVKRKNYIKYDRIS